MNKEEKVLKKNHRFYQLLLEVSLCLLPYSGLAYLLIVFIALFSTSFGIGATDVADNVLLYSGKIYLIISLFTMFNVISYSYLESRAYFESFYKFIRQTYKECAFGLIMSLAWPVFWLRMDKYLRRRNKNWADIVYDVFVYWVNRICRGVKGFPVR